MSKLILHISFHKTGSTSLQYSLKMSEEDLSNENYIFLKSN
jgi:hypothetical protein